MRRRDPSWVAPMDAYESLLARRSRRPVRFVVVLVDTSAPTSQDDGTLAMGNLHSFAV